MMKTFRFTGKYGITAAMLVLALLIAACGGAPEAPAEEEATPTRQEIPTAAPIEEPTEEPEPTAEPEPTEEPVEEEAMEEEEEMAEEEMAPTIVEIAVEDGRFETLVAAVTAAGLAETLSGDGPFTVFAPTDDAFAALPEGTVEALLEDPEGALTDVLLYHVVDGAVMAETVVTLDSATTLGGDDVTITVDGGTVFLNDSVEVIITDIEGSNGVIHVIDTVLLPPAMTAEADEEMMAEEDVPQGGTVVLMGHQEVAGLSPNDSGPSVQFVMIANIHNNLVRMDENLRIVPTLAESYEVSDDGLTYTFNLREGILFHDGEEFTSEDVAYTFEFYGDPENGSTLASEYASVESVETPDDYTVIVNLSQPNAPFITVTATNYIVPAHYHAEVGEEVYRTAPIGTGPFQLSEWRPAEFTELVAFDDHFRGRPNIDVLRLDVVPEPSVRAIALDTGDADSSVWPILVEDSLRFEEADGFTVYRSPSAAVNHFPLNNQDPILGEKAVRQAMMFAIDRQQVIDDIFSGAAVVAETNVSPALSFWFNPDTVKYPFDPEQAMALLDEAGWMMGDDGVRVKDGTPLSFTCTVITGDQARRPEAELVQQFLGDVGIEMLLEEAPVSAILEGMRNATLQCSLYNWTYAGGGASGDPESSSTLLSDGANNFSQFRNERIDELKAAGLVETDPDARKVIYDEVQAIIAEEVPFIYMMYWDGLNVFSDRVQGLPESALTAERIYTTAYQWWVEE
ncbi:MAG: ABC transporter substrate-binding protein [Chloroflexota bacterium]